mgnify:CR=1 FL=1
MKVKKHLKYTFKLLFTEKRYLLDGSIPKDLYLFCWLVDGRSSTSFDRWISSEHKTYTFEQVKIERTSDSLIITLEADYLKNDENKDDKFIMPLENFKAMVEEWKKLVGRRVPKFYFILEDDGTVIVRESLEE